MAVYTPLSADDLAALLAQYDIGAPLAFEGIAAGVENSNFKLTTAQGCYILTLLERRVAESDLPFFIGVMARLAERGFPAPKPIAAKNGEYLTRAKNKPSAIVSFLDGDWHRQPNLEHCRAIGEALGRMHSALEGFELTRANALGPHGWETLIRPQLAAAEFLRPGLARAIEQDLADVRARWPADLPKGAIHADLFPDNALFVGEKLSGVIDFYFACTDFLSYDVAVCLNAWCFEGEREYDLAKGRALIAAYESVRPLTPAEREAFPALARGAALRFFATRLADWAEMPAGALVKPKDPLEYADKLAFHRGVVGARDYGG